MAILGDIIGALLPQPRPAMELQQSSTEMVVALTSRNMVFPIDDSFAPKIKPKSYLLAHISSLPQTPPAIMVNGFSDAPNTRQNEGHHSALKAVKFNSNPFLKRPSADFPKKIGNNSCL